MNFCIFFSLFRKRGVTDTRGQGHGRGRAGPVVTYAAPCHSPAVRCHFLPVRCHCPCSLVLACKTLETSRSFPGQLRPPLRRFLLPKCGGCPFFLCIWAYEDVTSGLGDLLIRWLFEKFALCAFGFIQKFRGQLEGTEKMWKHTFLRLNN
jgi:hypothetical protein